MKEVNAITKEVDTITKEVATVTKKVDAITKEVATITKEDGFLWLKSENRVDYNLNPRQEVAPRFSAHLK